MQNLSDILTKADEFVTEFKKLLPCIDKNYKQAVQALFEEVNQKITFKQLSLFEKFQFDINNNYSLKLHVLKDLAELRGTNNSSHNYIYTPSRQFST